MNGLRILSALLAGGGSASGYRRAGYLILTIMVATAAWLMLSAMTVPFTGEATQTHDSGVTIRNGNMGSLPLRYARRVEGVQGVSNTRWMTYQLVECKQSPVVAVVLLGYGGPGTKYMFMHSFKGKDSLDAAAIARWEADPIGAIITSQAANDCGWRVGQTVEPPELQGMRHVLMHIIGLVPNKRSGAFVHFKYVNELGSFLGKDQVSMITTQAKDVHENELLAARIQSEFEHDFPPVEATTNALEQNAWARFGKVQQVFGFVMAMILLCAASVLVSVLAHAASERRHTFALLQVLGFGRRTLLTAVLAEGTLIIVVGAALGTGLGLVIAHVLGNSTFLGRLMAGGGLNPPAWAYLWMLAWLAGLLVVSLTAPMLRVAKVRPADYRAI